LFNNEALPRFKQRLGRIETALASAGYDGSISQTRSRDAHRQLIQEVRMLLLTRWKEASEGIK